MRLADHLVIVPVILPLVTGAFLLFFDERRRGFKAAVNLCSTALLVATAVVLLNHADASGVTTAVYLVGNWPAPFGIALVLDRLSALMLLLASVLALASLVFSLARWHRAGPHFHTLFQLLLMGVDGAFLTGDLFNLFVFFEILLAASYGLVLHGANPFRVRAGMHYIVINLAASSLFLIGVALVYGVTGTLNMADLAVRIPAVPPDRQALVEAGGALLGVAFLVKAGMWPLSFWLPNAYMAAAAPVAAVFAILSKVGIYVLLRLSPLLFGTGAGAMASFGDEWLLVGGMATIAFGAIGILASQALGRLAGYYILVSSGTLLAAIGVADIAVTSGALYYLVSSTLTIGAFFLLIELVERARDPAAAVLSVTMEAYGDEEDEEEPEEEVGIAIPGTLAALGACFGVCALLIAGLPPLSGFIGKFALVAALFNLTATGSTVPATAWILAALLLIAGFAALLAMMREGIRTFWAPLEVIVPRVRVIEIAPVAALLCLTAVLSVGGGPAMRYMDATARALHAPQAYIGAVLSTPARTAAPEARP
ncbi:MAG: monovalent cation/H+ antiporter subunit D [Rhizobiaceae bacterium]|nr:MAG: monovalent cation/H+ antiporter subunit D [Rhizobiaceae bacterium]